MLHYAVVFGYFEFLANFFLSINLQEILTMQTDTPDQVTISIAKSITGYIINVSDTNLAATIFPADISIPLS